MPKIVCSTLAATQDLSAYCDGDGCGLPLYPNPDPALVAGVCRCKKSTRKRKRNTFNDASDKAPVEAAPSKQDKKAQKKPHTARKPPKKELPPAAPADERLEELDWLEELEKLDWLEELEKLDWLNCLGGQKLLNELGLGGFLSAFLMLATFTDPTEPEAMAAIEEIVAEVRESDEILPLSHLNWEMPPVLPFSTNTAFSEMIDAQAEDVEMTSILAPI
jgi:hypothetical protein